MSVSAMPRVVARPLTRSSYELSEGKGETREVVFRSEAGREKGQHD
jgi:hypothetical protein